MSDDNINPEEQLAAERASARKRVRHTQPKKPAEVPSEPKTEDVPTKIIPETLDSVEEEDEGIDYDTGEVSEVIESEEECSSERNDLPTDIVADSDDVHVSKEEEKGNETEIEEDSEENDLPEDESQEVEYETEDSEETATEEKAKRNSIHVQIGDTGERKSVKKFTNLNIPENIKVIPKTDDGYQNAIIEQYFREDNSTGFIGLSPKGITRVVLPFSGIYIDISTYTNREMFAIHRSTAEVGFVEKLESELRGAWNNTTNTSIGKKLSFEEWLRAIKLPDLPCIYWGIFNVNNPGINSYDDSICDNELCKHEFEIKKDNYEISFIAENSSDDIDQQCINDIKKGVNKNTIKSYKAGASIIRRKEKLTDSNFEISYGMPNLEETLNFLKFLVSTDDKDDVSDDLLARIIDPISNMYYNRNVTVSETLELLTYKTMLYTRKIIAPIFEEAAKDSTSKKLILKMVEVDDKFIPFLLNKLSLVDFKQFIGVKEVKRLIGKEGIYFRLRDVTCPMCKTKQRDTIVDIRDILFTRAEELESEIISM